MPRIGPETLDDHSNPESLLIKNGINAILVSVNFDIDVDETPEIILVDTTQFTSKDFRYIQRQTENLDIPIIALVDDKTASELDHEVGFTDFIFVPVKPLELLIIFRFHLHPLPRPAGLRAARRAHPGRLLAGAPCSHPSTPPPFSCSRPSLHTSYAHPSDHT